MDRSISPNAQIQLTIYNRDFAERFSNRLAVTVKSAGSEVSTTVYEGCYQDVYWAPDSSKYVLSFSDPEGNTQLILNRIAGSSSSDLNAYLSLGVTMSELSKAGWQEFDQGLFPDVHYQFLLWSTDSRLMLIYYTFTDAKEVIHEGYFWYDGNDGSVNKILEMRPV